MPTWSDHARELRRFIVSRIRYVARLCATIQTTTHSKPRRTP
jgi:hypothetical protein